MKRLLLFLLGVIPLLSNAQFPVQSSPGGFPVKVVNRTLPFYDGKLQSLFPTMTAPPTITIGKTTTSTVDASKVNGAVTVSVYDPRIQLTHGDFTNTETGLAKAPAYITLSDNSKTGGLAGVRFSTDAPAFEICFKETNGGRFNILVDGQFAYRNEQIRFTNSGNRRYVKVDFGTNVVSYSRPDAGISVVSGGTGYALGDIITMNGGTNNATGVPITLVVTQISGGAITNASILNKGAYTTLPTGNLTQVSTDGAGTGFSMVANFFARNHSTKKHRNIEILYTGGVSVFGVVTTSADIVESYKTNPLSPRIIFVGDSQSAGTYFDYPGSQMGYRIAQKLGMTDNVIISAQGGTGWNKDNGTSLRWSSSQRVADLISYQGDIYVFIGSQNDTNDGALVTSITTTLNTLRAALPNAYFIGIGNVAGNSTALANSIESGFLAANGQNRTRFINNLVPNQWINNANANNYWIVTGDANHYAQPGIDFFADLSANAISNALSEMIKNDL